MFVECGDKGLGTLRGDFLVVISREERSTIDSIMLLKEFLDSNERL